MIINHQNNHPNHVYVVNGLVIVNVTDDMNIDLEKIFEVYKNVNLVLVDGFDDAILGVDEESHRVIYSIDKCLQILLEKGMESTEAVEYFEFNVSGSYVGDKTPIWCDDLF
jgi:molybdopterin-guanine dinucleotide biosynthesis protein